MNDSTPFPSAVDLAPPAAPLPKIRPSPSPELPRLLLGLAVAVASFDLCFWHVKAMGFSVAVFCAALSAIILLNRPKIRWRRTTRCLLALLAGALLATSIETGVTNTFVLLILVVALAGDTFFADVESPWGRWLSQMVAWVRGPGRVFWLAGALLETAFDGGLGWMGSLLGGCLLAVPALVLALIFGSLLASGNAVFGSWTNSFFTWFWDELMNYLNADRMALWCLVAVLVLPLLRPVQVSPWWWSWTERLPRLPETVPARGALFCSGLILVVLNLLFFIANLADALFLWSGRTLPSGVSYSGFVHDGVNSLTMTVLLSAFVLTAIFQQALTISGKRGLKLLGLFWIGQNLFLLLSVALRLKNYIEAYDMTVTRLSVIIFLVLVAAGFVLLTLKIAQDRSLSWLIGGCMLAVFVTFYVTQFLDLAGWAANYNVARWENNRLRNVDAEYLVELGPPAWPAARHACEVEPANAVLQNGWDRITTNTDQRSTAEWNAAHWREFSLRAWLNRGALDDKK